MNCGSTDSLNVSTRCGLSPNSRQIRPIVERDRPVSAAIEARDQCVASFGVRSNVATITASICSSPMLRGPPGRGSSSQAVQALVHEPAPPLAHRRRHNPKLRCDLRVVQTLRTASTIFDRNAKACADFARRDHRSNCSRSSSLNINSAFGRPVLDTNQIYGLHHEFLARHTRTPLL